MSLTDELSSQLMNKAESGIPRMLRTGSSVAKNTMSGISSGIVLMFKGTNFTAETIMKAVGYISNNPKFSNQSVSVEELEKNSDIKKIDSSLTKEAMKHFDKACKKYGVKYNAVVDKSNKKDPTYYVFFKGKESDVIQKVMEESYQQYIKEQAKPRISVRAKLAFFRDKVATRDKEQQDLGKEKNNNRSDRQR